MAKSKSPLSKSGTASTQSQIRAVIGRIAEVQAQISEVVETVKAVQAQIVEVSAVIESTETLLDQTNLPIEKREILKMKFKSLIDEKGKLMDKEKGLMDEKKSLMDKEKGLMDQEGKLIDKEKGVLMDKEMAMLQSSPPFPPLSFPDPFFAALEGATLEGRVLRLNSDDHFELFSRELYVRDCWEKMYQVMLDRIGSGCKHIVVTGSPGVGKSQFLQYCMWRLAQEGESFLHETQPERVFHYSPGAIARHSYDDLPPGIPYLVDLKEARLPCVAYAIWVPRFTAVFSSPNPSRFKEILKFPSSVELVMPPWSDDEIFDAHQLISTFRKVDIGVVKSQLAVYGGVPRFVFEKSDSGIAQMNKALSAKGAAIAEKIFVVDFGTGKDDDLSNTLALMSPENPDTFIGRNYHPASGYVFEKLSEKHFQIMLSKMHEITKMKESAGGMFEFMASRFALTGNVHNVSRLIPTGKETSASTSPILSGGSLSVGKFEILPPNWQSGNWIPSHGILYYQNKVNMQSVDALMVEGRELFLFQLTVGSSHSVKGNGLEKIVELFSKAGVIETSSLVFVVPEDSVLVKVQPLLKSDNTVFSNSSPRVNLLTRHMSTEQYIIRLDLNKVTQQNLSTNT